MIRTELSLLLRRPRTWLSLLLLVSLPTGIAIFVAATGVAPRPGTGPPFLAQILGNGQLFAAGALAIVLPLFLPIAVLVVAGDSVAGEAASGTLRYLLVRPVARRRLLVAKLVSVITFVLLAVLVVSLAGFAVGSILFSVTPGGGLPTLSGGPPITGWDAIFRVVVSVLYVGVSMLGVASFGIFFSVIVSQPLAATLGGLAVLVSSSALDLLDAAGSVSPYLPTHYWLAFVDLFRQPILWRDVERGLGLQSVYVVALLALSWAYFSSKDITS